MLQKVIEELKSDRTFLSSVAHWEVIPAKPGKFAELPPDLDLGLKQTLVKRGITSLYLHQKRCYDAVRNHTNVVVVTPTASGKTLSYNLPVMQTLLEEPDARALYLFPTKALSQDQQAGLNDVVLGGEIPVKIFTYDGDTPRSIRISARQEGRIVITNPDMLHTGILPNHPRWIKFLTSIRFIVIDEVHIYRGVFGSHFSNVIRRLKSILSFYGARPVFICCSATIGNPLELAQNIIKEKAMLIDENGAPSGERHFILYNPPLVDAVQGIRRGVMLEAQKIAVTMLKKGIKTIVFARSRVRTELIASYIKDALKNMYTDDMRIKVASYRGGYLPTERRIIEKGLRDGDIKGVVSTNALELGIDIGGLDVSVLAGFPGSISSSWQQAGRAGREASVSLSILIASASPMDQYMVNHPEYFFGKSPESGWIDPDNMFILMDQLKCALFELPFESTRFMDREVADFLAYLEEKGVIRFTGGKWYWSDRTYPAENVSLRSATQHNVVIINTTGGQNQVIGEMDVPSAKMLLYDHAIYLHMGNQFVVKQLDLENLKCFVEETKGNFYTDSIVKTDIKVLHKDREVVKGAANCAIGDILVRTQATKFKKLKFRTHENLGYGDINLPAEEMHTRSIALLFTELSPAGENFLSFTGDEQGTVMQRLGYVIKNVAPVFLLCDPNDIGVAERVKDPFFGVPCLYIYDNYAGGTGLSEGFLENAETILSAAYDLVAACRCSFGCPSCIGPVEQQGDMGKQIKEQVLLFLHSMRAGNE
ncbi:MAG: DEAD/DEAH box helicase [Spirochaetales bacterium]|nr:DEAD/DEAH box helicase [Spirochaetales bacterium]